MIIHNCEEEIFRCHGNEDMMLEAFYHSHDEEGYCKKECLQINVMCCPFCGYKPQ